MALYSGRLLMRGGNESEFDPDKMMPREWAVSTDKGIVRICFKPGVCIRMATYEAFEEDMAKIEEILEECQSIQEAVIRINTEVSQNADAVAEYTAQAKKYRDEAKTSAGNAKTSETNTKTSEVNAKASETNAKVSEEHAQAVFESLPEDYGTLSKEFYEVAIKQKASGENIHVTDSANAKVREFSLFGKAKQQTTSGKQLFDANRLVLGSNDALDISEDTYTITVSGGKNHAYANSYYSFDLDLVCGKTIYFNVDSITRSNSNAVSTAQFIIINADNTVTYMIYSGTVRAISIPEDAKEVKVTFYSNNSTQLTENNTSIFKGVRVSFEENVEWEKFSGGMASPNPDYPQEIEVSGESYNLLENTATSQTINGVTFTVNDDGSVTANGTATKNINFAISELPNLPNENLILSGCKDGSTSTYLLSYTNYVDFAYFDVGKGIEISKFDYALYPNAKVQIQIYEGTVLNNVVFYPMIRKASVKNDRYMPYGKGSVEVKSVGSQLFDYENNLKVVDGLSIVVNNDKSLSINGNTTKHYAEICTIKNIDLPKGNYFISGGANENGKVYARVQRIFSDGKVTWTANNLFVIDGTETQVKLTIQTGGYLGAIDCTIYPMLNKGTTALPFEPYKEITDTIPTDGLAGIKVSSNGNYTDSNGQQWICDEIVKYADGSGEKIQRVVELLPDDFKVTGFINDGFRIASKRTDVVRNSNALCTHMLINNNLNQYSNVGNYLSTKENDSMLKVRFSRTFADLEECKTYMRENNYKFYAVISEPIRTPLTAEQITEIEKLQTFNHVTNITNDFDCGMDVMYMADAKSYIDNRLAQIEQALIANI